MLKSLFKCHRILERMESIASNESWSPQKVKAKLNRLDLESANYMRAAEKRSRKIKSGLIPFSPEAINWLPRKMVYSLLLFLRLGRKKNRGNLIRLACSAGILNPLRLSVKEIRTGLRVCKIKCKDLQKTGWLRCRQNLHSCCDSARAQEDHVALCNILAIIRKECDKAFWSCLQCTLRRKRGCT